MKSHSFFKRFLALVTCAALVFSLGGSLAATQSINTDVRDVVVEGTTVTYTTFQRYTSENITILYLNGKVTSDTKDTALSVDGEGCAITTNSTVEGDVYGIYATNGADVDAEGSVSASTDGGAGVYAAGEETNVYVNATAEGDIGVEATDGATVQVTGHVQGQSYGVKASNGAEVEVDGGIPENGKRGSIGILAESGASVTSHNGAEGVSGAIQATGSGTLVEITDGGAYSSAEGVSTVKAADGATIRITAGNTVADGEHSYAVEVVGENSSVVAANVMAVESDGTAVVVSGKGSSATLTGDVQGDNGISASQGGSVQAQGDVTAALVGVSAWGENSQVTVQGSVESTKDGGEAISAEGATVVVEKDVTGKYLGISAEEEAVVLVKGNVTVDGTNPAGIIAQSGSTVTVLEEVSSNYYGVVATGEDTDVNVGSVTLTSDAADTMGISAVNGGNVTVVNNVTGGEISVYALAGGTVTVCGDVTNTSTTEDAVAVRVTDAESIVNVEGDVAAKGLWALGLMVTNEGSAEVFGDVSGDGNAVDVQNASAYVHGDVNSNKGYGVAASVSSSSSQIVDPQAGAISGGSGDSPESIVYVDGDVKGGASGIYASGSIVNIGGDVSGKDCAVEAYSSASVYVEGDALGGYNGIMASGDTTIVVGGDVTSQGMAVAAVNGSLVDVIGDVTATGTDSFGIVSSGNDNLAYASDVTADGTAVVFLDGEDSSIVVTGTAAGTYGFAVCEDLLATESGNIFLVKDLDGDFGILDGQTGEVTLADETQAEQIAELVYYIVNRVSMRGATLTGTSTTLNDYETAQEGDELIVSGKRIKSVSAGDNVNIIENEDGTFTIQVLRGGELDIYVVRSGPIVQAKLLPDENYLDIPLEVTEKGVSLAAVIVSGKAELEKNISRCTLSVAGERIGRDAFQTSIQGDELFLTLSQEVLDSLPEGESLVVLDCGGSAFKVLIVKTADGDGFQYSMALVG